MEHVIGTVALVTASLATCSLAEVHEVSVGNDFFSPAAITVSPGDTVRWVSAAGFHTATSGDPCAPGDLFNGPVDPFNPIYEWIVPEDIDLEVVPYFCFFHCGHMTGTITIDLTPRCAPADLNCSGAVDVQDLLILLANWG